MSYSRFAIYFVPAPGPLAAFGATWLGWDMNRGRDVPQPAVPGLEDITTAPRRYGFHGTLKPPFRLAEDCGLPDLEAACAVLAGGLGPARCDGLALRALGRFLALTPQGDMAALRDLASACVRDLDALRAPASDAELARRREAGLSAAQEALLAQWGYPYVMEEFRFHLTLTGPLPPQQIPAWTAVLHHHLPDLPATFEIDAISLCGERADGRFEVIRRYRLTG